VLSADIQRLEIYNNSPTAPIGYPRQFAVNGVAANGTRTDLTLAATWTSSDSTVAMVNSANGQVNGVAVGNATISALYGNLSTSVELTVTSIPIVTTVIGGLSGDADGLGRLGRVNEPRGLAVDSGGKIYIADFYNHKIRRFDPLTLALSTIAGTGISGYEDGPGNSAQLSGPWALAIDRYDNLYVSEQTGNRIRKISLSDPSLTVSTLAGNGMPGFKDSAIGSSDATGVQFNSPQGIATDPDGNVYVADTGNYSVRKIQPTGYTTTLAGTVINGFRDGIGSEALFNSVGAIAIDPNQGNIFVSDPPRLRKITPMGLVTTAVLDFGAQSMTITATGTLYFGTSLYVGYVKLFEAAPKQSGLAGRGCCFADGPAAEADFSYVLYGITHDRSGALYVADSSNHAIRKISPIEPTNTN
jgi:hypothetical protein